MQLDRHGMTTLEVEGQSLILLPDRAAFDEAENTLYIADTHFGKEATFQRLAIPVPSQIEADLQRLTLLLQATGAHQLVVLGDLIHHRKGRSRHWEPIVADWRQRHADVECVLVRGNHDRSAGDPPDNWQFTCLDGPTQIGAWSLRHEPDPYDKSVTLCGHLHPKYQLKKSAGDAVCLPCFWQLGSTVVFPAFSSFVDGRRIRPTKGDSVFLTTDERVVPVRGKSIC